MSKVTLIDTTPVPVEKTYSLTLEGLSRKDVSFLRTIFGRITGSYNGSPRRVTSAIFHTISEFPPIEGVVDHDSITAPDYDDIP